MFKLVISDDEGKTTVVPLVRDEITIGRKDGNTIRLTERNVSRRHARLMKANGAFTVEDLKSYNGVRVNGHRVDGAANLSPGDQISIGDYQLALQLEASEAETVAKKKAEVVAEAQTAMIEAPSAEPIPPARLVMLSPPAPGAEFALNRPRIRLGRAEDLEVWINHRSISREHAEVIQDGGRFQIKDLGSANGVRVNGQEITQAPLKPGDVVELGQVRFRFVSRGETYIFDADRTIQMGPVEATTTSKAPILAALAIIGAAIVVAVMVALSGGERTPQVTEIEPVIQPPSEPPTEPPPVEVTQLQPSEAAPAPRPAAFDDALGNCQAAVEAGRFSEAVSHGRAALQLAADNPEARTCLSAAEAGHQQQQTFDRGVQAMSSGDVDAAHFAFEELPADSPLRQRGEVAQAATAFAERHLRAAQSALRSNAVEAIREANTVLSMSNASDNHRRMAQRIQRAARRRGPRVAVRQTEGEARQVAEVQPPPVASGNPLTDCHSERNYSRCVIDRLEGRAGSARELAALIEAYRGIGNSTAAFRHMQTFIRNYPGNRANAYRQILLNNGREVPF